MPQQTPNIGLTQFDRTSDKPEKFIDYRDAIAGTGANSNMTLIDDEFGQLANVINEIKGTGWTDETIKSNSDTIDVLKSRGIYTVQSSGVNSITATVSEVAGTPTQSSVFLLIPNNANTTTVTLSINGETAKPVNKARGKSGTVTYDALEAKDLRPNTPVFIRKSNDGNRYILINFGEDFARNVFYDNGDSTFETVQSKINTIDGSVETLDTSVNTHVSEVVFTEQGVHGIRFFNEKLEYFDGTDWVEIQTGGGGGGIPIGNVSNFEAQSGNQQITLLWTDPNDIIFEGTPLATWGGTKILRKTGSYPVDENDGILVVDNTIRNQYETTGFVDSGLTNDTEYFYMAFPYTTDGLVTNNVTNRISATPTDVTFDYAFSIDSFSANAGNTEVVLSWNNPTDASFTGVMIRRSSTAYPTGITDGTLVYNGALETYTDTGLTNDILYYYRAFTYSVIGGVTSYNITTTNQQVSATPVSTQIYGVKIDTTNSNPETALTYTDGAIGFTPASGNNGNFSYGSWEDKFPFNQIKPCLFLNGSVNYYLDPNDYTKREDGVTASDITSGADGDVMVEFPKVFWKFETIGTDLYIKYSDTQVDASYKSLAHQRGATNKDKIYVSAYMGHTLSTKLRSLSGKLPTTLQTIGTFRTQAQANGSGYDQMAYYPLLMLQVLFTVMFKDRDSQTTLGRGYVDGNSSAIGTGGTNAKGMFYGESTGKLQNKFCGIEDFWGNTYYFIDGIFSNATYNILIGNDNFNDTGSGYTDYGQGATANLSGYIGDVQGGTETGFIVKSTDGSGTTEYCDFGYLYASRLAYFGGYWDNASVAGAFLLQVIRAASSSDASIAARLCFI